MPLLTVTNLLTSPIAFQDPTGLYGTVFTVPGSGSVTNLVISNAALGALEPLLIAQRTALHITYTASDDPASQADSVSDRLVTVLTTPYTAAAGDQDILTNLTTPGAVSVVLAVATPIGHLVRVIDDKGDAATNNVTITVASGGTINGGANVVINVNRGQAWLLKKSATAWVAVLSSTISAAAAGGALSGTYPNPALAAIFASAPQALSGAGAVNVTSRTTLFTSTGASQALTLANGSVTGQMKTVHHTVDGGSGVLTPASAGNFATVTFTSVHDWAEFEWSGSVWNVVAFSGATIG